MIDKFYVDIYLVITAVSTDPNMKDQCRFLVINENSQITFPKEPLNKCETSKDIAVRLMENYSGVNQNWAIIFPFGIIDDVGLEKDTVSVLYGVFIPDVTRLRIPNTSWKTYLELETSEEVTSFTKKLAYEAIWRQI